MIYNLSQPDNLLKVRFISTLPESELHQTRKVVPLTLKNKDSGLHLLWTTWWIAEVDNIEHKMQDVHVIFYHTPGPRTSFKKQEKDQVWMLIKNTAY